MTANRSELQTLEIRKYQNRRYYDTTTSRHLSLQDIHKLIVEGHNVRIVDAQTEQDITAKILTQILLDYEPLKLEVFSNELLTQAIRVNDSLLRDFVDLYFRQAFEAFCGSRRRFQSMLREAHQLTTTLARPETWISGFFPGWGPDSAPQGKQPESAGPAKGPETENLKNDIEQLRQEIGELRAQLGSNHPVAHREHKELKGHKEQRERKAPNKKGTSRPARPAK